MVQWHGIRGGGGGGVTVYITIYSVYSIRTTQYTQINIHGDLTPYVKMVFCMKLNIIVL